jgi:hypothetical protein
MLSVTFKHDVFVRRIRARLLCLGGEGARPKQAEAASFCFSGDGSATRPSKKGSTPMATTYEARWISKPRRDGLLRSGRLRNCIVLDSLNGFIAVEPVGSDFADGEVLSPEDACTELSDAWCREPRSKLTAARNLLHLDDHEPALAMR